MRFVVVLLCGAGCALLLAAGPGQQAGPVGTNPENVSSQPPRPPEEERKSFHLPAGFEIQLVAAEPYVRKPINMNFDDRGRLWVTESLEYPFPATAGAHARDTVRIYQDTNGDGLADEVTTFTSGLNIPIGVLPVTRGAIIYSIPYIYRFTDSNGDDRADQRRVLLGKIGHADTHGMTGNFTWGFDGWVYACHGFSNDSEVKASDGSTVKMNSGNTYRFKPDGSHVEQWTHGQVNPFGLTFDPLGNLYSCDCETRPVYMLLRGGYYPSFGKPDDGLGFGPEMINHGHGSSAIAGLAYYAADHFPPAYRDRLFVGNVVTNRINWDRLERHGSTLEAVQEQPDFLISDDPWFRPVDIKVGPDGALYVLDFYNRIIGHYEVPLTHPGRDHTHGRIWRIVYRGPSGKARPPVQPRADWSKATVTELVHDLGHPNLVVRMKATNQLVERGGRPAVEAVRPLMQGKSTAFQRMHGLWVLQRLGALDNQTITAVAKDPEAGVRVHLMHVLSERPELPAGLRRLVLNGLNDADAMVQRAAADALGTHPSADNIRPLLDLRHKVPADDTHLLHVVRMALRDQLKPAGNWQKLPAGARKEADARAIADVAPGVHSPEAAAYLISQLEHWPENADNQVRFVKHIARFGNKDLAGRLLTFVRGQRTAGLGHQLALFRALHEGTQDRGAGLNNLARKWAEHLATKLLTSKDQAELLAGIDMSGSLHMTRTQEFLARVATDQKAPEGERTAAMAALVAIDSGKHIALLGRLLADASEPYGLREKAVETLGRINQPAAQAELFKALEAAPERLEGGIATALAASRRGAEKLLETIAAGKASARLLQEPSVLLTLERAGIPDFKERLAKLTKGLAPADSRLEELMNRRRAGFASAKADLAAGAKVFEKNCAICHRLQNKGTKVGPELDGVGIRGADRLVEDILDPNRNVDQAFRSTTLGLTDGRIVSGLLLREEGQVLVLADNQGKEVRVPKSDVDDRKVSQLSPMPADFAEKVPEADFYNLLAFLLTQQPAKEKQPKRPGGRASR
ncbi:MAG TPA: PVC-type heme-binding CxxCH protein [Gemmataceae bacterium]|nr:PVC-type heme-binding CxxCH protein [Gemmataceae bacterium]